MVYEDFSWSWSEFRQFNADWFRSGAKYVRYDRQVEGSASEARNTLVRRMYGDWLFFTDTDHDVQPDVLIRMLDRMISYKVEVVCGLYQQRGAPHHPVLYDWRDGKFLQLDKWQLEPFQVAAAGCGCLLVGRSVFARIRDELKEEPFNRIEGYSEDLSFFLRLLKLEMPVLCDPRLLHPHLRVRAVMPSDLQQAS